jgi:RNA polymerase sigma-70 factor, ECF subfamily
MRLTQLSATEEESDGEAQLIAQAKVLSRSTEHGNPPFAELYRMHVDVVYRYIYARTGDAADAHDITSQTFLSALERIHNYQGRGRFAAWLLGIARRKVGDYYRLQRKTRPLNGDAMQFSSMEDTLHGKLKLERVIVVLRSLTADRAEAVSLYIFGELNIDEIAREMRRSKAAVRKLINRGLHDLRGRLGGDE